MKSYDGIICDGAIRSGKTVCMTDGFFLWSMCRFDGQAFGICGKTVVSLRRNIIANLRQWLGGILEIQEYPSQSKLVGVIATAPWDTATSVGEIQPVQTPS